MSARSLLRRDYDIVHIHWPDALLNGRSRVRIVLRLLALTAALAYARRRGPVVWTAHNLSAHDCRFPALERAFWRLLPLLVSHVLVLSEAGRRDLLQAHPKLGGKYLGLTRHGTYTEVYGSPTPEICRCRRAQLGVSDQAKLVLFFGRIQRYKGLPNLIREFRKIERPDSRLVVCGEVMDEDLHAEIQTLASSDRRVLLHLQRVADDQVAATIGAADLMVLPYVTVSNSGAALLALSYGCPVLVPALPVFRELGEHAGDGWVRLAQGAGGQVTASDIAEALSNVDELAGRIPSMGHFAWDAIADHTFELFTRALDDRSAVGSSAEGRGAER